MTKANASPKPSPWRTTACTVCARNIARIFNTYGPRMQLKDGRVVPAFIDQALHGEPMTVFGDGSQTRSFCYVSDLVRGLFLLSTVGRALSRESRQSARDDDSRIR